MTLTLLRLISNNGYRAERHSRLITIDDTLTEALLAYERGDFEMDDDEARLVFELEHWQQLWRRQPSGVGRHRFHAVLAQGNFTLNNWNVPEPPAWTTPQEQFAAEHDLEIRHNMRLQRH